MSTEDFTEGFRLVRKVDNFPRPGVTFYDLTPLMADALFFGRAMERFARRFSRRAVDYVVSPESRGYMFGAALASKIGAGFVPVARNGSLPFKSIKVQCPAGYHHDINNVKELSMHEDALPKGAKVLIVDDILGSGHTALACRRLATSLGAEVVEAAFFLEIPGLEGRKLLGETSVYSLMTV
jgi:adenine phosphoribosyltransferase